MRRKKEKTVDPKFDSIIEQANLINDADALLDWYQSISELYEGDDHATVFDIYAARRKKIGEQKKKNAPTELTIIYPETEKKTVETEVVDEPTETVSEAAEVEYNDKVGAAFMNYEAKQKEILKRIRETESKIAETKSYLKDLNVLKDDLQEELKTTVENGHEAFIEQPTLFDDLEEN